MDAQTKRVNRRLHFWLAVIIFIPSFIVITSGLVLQVKKQIEWVQPPTQKGKAPKTNLSEPIGISRVLTIVQGIQSLEISDWSDIDKLDVRPSKAMLKVITKQHWEVQLDLYSGEVLQIAQRRSDWIEAIHDGSFFHSEAKLWVFLPNGIALFLMLISGLIMFAPNLLKKAKKWVNRK